mmetsp:Transcript_38314/g.105525  ORF Transcript_38314/g.105525 Transcript_38314/m.105525 type:complete len:314 (+) Transcript_38314:56-997(+)
MAPIVVQPVGGSRATMEIELLPPTAIVADLKSAIAARIGAKPALQRLVARGRVLTDSECLGDAGIAEGGRVFLAIARQEDVVGDALGDDGATNDAPEDDIVSANAVDYGLDLGATPTRPETTRKVVDVGGFEVMVRAMDSEEDVRVFAQLSAPVIEFKREALRRLHSPVNVQDAEMYKFVCGGRLLGTEGNVSDLGLFVGVRVVVVPPRPLPAQPPCRRWRRLLDIGAVVEWACAFAHAAIGMPRAILQWLFTTWHDPWSLVRPSLQDNTGQGRGRRIQTLDFRSRSLRYGPGQNPNGEDLTMLLSQGLVGGG